MRTKQLYYIDPYCREFQAQVLACEKTEGGFAVVLDQTAFYPEGGGQSSDAGTLDGVPVLDVQLQADRILHLCEQPLEPGKTVSGKIDWERRFDLMQQHSGEHLVSGLIHKAFGFDNVGFHMGTEVITIDFDGILNMEQLAQIEQQANKAVWEDIETQILYPNEQELPTYQYRSKKELSGWVRLVRFGDVDLCACCGTHVARTGEIGLIKLLSCVHFHEGVRIEMLCGQRALRYLSAVLDQNKQVSALLSAKPLETAQQVERLQQELSQVKYRMHGYQERIFALEASSCADRTLSLHFCTEMEPEAVRRFANACMQVCGGLCAVFSGDDGAYKYAVGQKDGDVRALVKAMNAELNGRGGGKPPMAQGSVFATRTQIETFFESLQGGEAGFIKQ